MKSILIIEDDRYLTRTLANILKLEGYNPLSAHDVESAMLKLRSHYPDLILCDIALGRDNGYKFLRKLRKSPLYRNIPFIFVSGKVKAQEVMHGLKSGADDYITKPFEYISFVDKVRSQLERVCNTTSGFPYKLSNT